MDAESQKNHLKAYGITYWIISKELKVKWLLNYRGGSFLLPDTKEIQRECQIRGVSYEVMSDAKTESILEEISSPSQNMEAVILEKRLKLQFIPHTVTNLGMMRLQWPCNMPKFPTKQFMTKKF